MADLNKYGLLDREVVGSNFDPTKQPMEKLIADLQNNVVRFVYRKALPKNKEFTLDLLMNDMQRVAYGTRNAELISYYELKKYLDKDKTIGQLQLKAIGDIRSFKNLIEPIPYSMDAPADVIKTIKAQNKQALLSEQNGCIETVKTMTDRNQIANYIKELMAKNLKNDLYSARSEQAEQNGSYIKYYDLEQEAFRTFRYNTKEGGNDSIENRLLACEVGQRGAFKGLSWKTFSTGNLAWYEIINCIGENAEETSKYAEAVLTVGQGNTKKRIKAVQDAIYSKYTNGNSVQATVSTNKYAENIGIDEFNGVVKPELREVKKALDESRNKEKIEEAKEKIKVTTSKYEDGLVKFLNAMANPEKTLQFSQEYFEIAQMVNQLISTLLCSQDNPDFKVLGYDAKTGITKAKFDQEEYALSPIFVLNYKNGQKYLDTKKIFTLGRPRTTDMATYVEPLMKTIIEFIEGQEFKIFAPKTPPKKVAPKKKEVKIQPVMEEDFKRLINMYGFAKFPKIDYNLPIQQNITFDKKTGLTFDIGGERFNFTGIFVSLVTPNGLVIVEERTLSESYKLFAERIMKSNSYVDHVGEKKGFKRGDGTQETKAIQRILAQFLLVGADLREKHPSKKLYKNLCIKFVGKEL